MQDRYKLISFGHKHCGVGLELVDLRTSLQLVEQGGQRGLGHHTDRCAQQNVMTFGHRFECALDYFFGTADRKLGLGGEEAQEQCVEAVDFGRLKVGAQPSLPWLRRAVHRVRIVVETCLSKYSIVVLVLKRYWQHWLFSVLMSQINFTNFFYIYILQVIQIDTHISSKILPNSLQLEPNKSVVCLLTNLMRSWASTSSVRRAFVSIEVWARLDISY